MTKEITLRRNITLMKKTGTKVKNRWENEGN